VTEVNPPGFLQNAGATHTAEITREIMNVLTGGGQTSGSTQRARGGVHPSLGSKFSVTQAGSPNMTVDVGSGHALIPGTENLKQAVYSCFNDGTVSKAIAASDPSLPRIDLVVIKVQDSFYSGAPNTWSIAVVTGVAAGSPAVPTAPANSIILAQVAVGAGVTSIVTANITDRRFYLTATGGIIPVRDQAERDALVGAYDGLTVWRQDIDAIQTWNGASWVGGAGILDIVRITQAGAYTFTATDPSELTKLRSASVTVINGQMYRFHGQTLYTAITDPWTLEIRKGSAAGTIVGGVRFRAEANGDTCVWDVTWPCTLTETVQFYYVVNRLSGAGALSVFGVNDGFHNTFATIENLGASTPLRDVA
jgi:hypothetical protein